MIVLFIVTDKNGRKIRLTEERWSHIAKEHPNVNVEDIKTTLETPTKISLSKYNPDNVKYFYNFNKEKKKYLLVAVKFLNGEAFIITSYYVRNIK